MPSTTFQNLQQTARARWLALAPREQRSIGVAAAVVGAALAWGLLIAPALATLRKVESQRAALESSLESMLRLQVRAQALQARAVIAPQAAQLAMQNALAPLGDAARLQLAGDRATVTLQKVEAPALAQWLAALGGAAQVRPAEVHLLRDAGASATWSGTLVFNLPSGK